MKILVTINEKDVAPRFDLTNEVIIAESVDGKIVSKPRSILLSRSSAEELCGLILKENITLVVCGGIEESHYKYLTWKNVEVVDSVIGPYAEAMRMANKETLVAGAILPGAVKQNEG